MKRVSIRDVARHCGLGVSTVSHAMRGDGTVSAKTRERVQNAAKELGYVPDPLLASIATRKFKQAPMRKAIGIAYYDKERAEATWDENYWSYYSLIEPRAKSLGYWTERIDGRKHKLDARLAGTLYAKGVGAIILGNLRDASIDQGFEWDRFTVVCCNNNPFPFGFNRVAGAVFQSFRLAWSKLWNAGYRRIGAAICSHEVELEDDTLRYAAYLECSRHCGERAIPAYRGGITNKEAFLSWLREHKPEAVIGFNNLHWWWLQEAGGEWSKVPIVLLHILPDGTRTATFTGIKGTEVAIAEQSVDLVDKLFRIREVGLPSKATTILCLPEWQEGGKEIKNLDLRIKN